MDGPQTFEFRTAPVGPRVRVTVDRQSARIGNGGAARSEIAFVTVRGGRWSQTQLRYAGGAPSIVSRRLTLYGPDGAISLRQGRLSPSKDAEAQAFLGAVRAMLEALGGARPDIEIDIGAAPYLRWLMSAFGVAAGLAGLFALIGALAALVTAAWIEAVIFMALGASLGASGLMTLLSYNPFKPAVRLSPATLAASLSGES